MEDRLKEDFHDWEILPDHEFGSSRRLLEPQDHDNAGFVDGNYSGMMKPQYLPSDPAANFVGIHEGSGEDTSACASKLEDPKLVDPCLEACCGETAVETQVTEAERPNKYFNSGHFLSEIGVSEPEEMAAEMTTRSCEEGKEVGGGSDSGGTGSREFSVAEEASKERAWWTFPFQFAKIFVSRLSPFWSLSVGVVAIGFLLLGRRWYKAKRKIRCSPITVCVEDKQKASQFMIQAARLNEAFSVVRRVPVIRSSMLSTGASSWPVIALK